MTEILGKWTQGLDQPYPGLWFEFKADGTFQAKYDAYGIVSGGTYTVEGDQIDMDQTSHTFGLIGQFKGIFAVEEDVLKMAVAEGPDHPRPQDLTNARLYQKTL